MGIKVVVDKYTMYFNPKYSTKYKRDVLVLSGKFDMGSNVIDPRGVSIPDGYFKQGLVQAYAIWNGIKANAKVKQAIAEIKQPVFGMKLPKRNRVTRVVNKDQLKLSL